MTEPEDIDDFIVILPDEVDVASLSSGSHAPPRSPPRAPAPVRPAAPGKRPPAGTASPRPTAPSPGSASVATRQEPRALAPRAEGASAGGRARGPRRWSARRLLYLTGSFSGVAVVLGMIGFVAFVLQRGYLANYYPSPGALIGPHAQLSGTPEGLNCNGCHALTGLTNGCLGCHEEIEGQLSDEHGLHHLLLEEKDVDCSECHHEHRGARAPLVTEASWQGLGPVGFSHPQVAFELTCKHRELDCSECHERKRRVDVALPRFPDRPRPHTFLGLTQECASCHEDIHSHGLSSDCVACHDQAAFRPAARFDHGAFFPLEGGHSQVACARCHRLPDASSEPVAQLSPFAPFAVTRGTRCVECHASPHRTSFAMECADCHQETPKRWEAGRGGMTLTAHASTGFVLSSAHAAVSCEKCHEEGRPYAERFRDPSQRGYDRRQDSCGGCHRDVHDGQFAALGMACGDCHRLEEFKPHDFTIDRHAAVFPLLGAHARASCEGCHKVDPQSQVRRFAGVSQDCASCHTDPHGGQFVAEGRSCSECHDPAQFVPSAIDQEAHEAVFPLAGSHRAVPCTSCHQKDPDTEIRGFAGTTRECKGCHRSPHGDQFAKELAVGDCTTCHKKEPDSFVIGSFDHEHCVGFSLVGAHANATCQQCHLEREAPRPDLALALGGAASGGALPAERIRVFRGTSRECSSCHRDVHLGQFQSQGDTDCSRCHDPAARWPDLRFNHNQQARFQLDGNHAHVPCDGCHRPVPLPDGGSVRLFKPLGASCNDCHTVIHQ